MSKFKFQIKSKDQMPKFLDFGIWYLLDICLPERSPALRGEGRDFEIWY
jgi:hypothetical protein